MRFIATGPPKKDFILISPPKSSQWYTKAGKTTVILDSQNMYCTKTAFMWENTISCKILSKSLILLLCNPREVWKCCTLLEGLCWNEMWNLNNKHESLKAEAEIFNSSPIIPNDPHRSDTQVCKQFNTFFHVMFMVILKLVRFITDTHKPIIMLKSNSLLIINKSVPAQDTSHKEQQTTPYFYRTKTYCRIIAGCNLRSLWTGSHVAAPKP